jgi:hypothetical protein
MSEKSAFKSMMEGFIEKSIVSSPHFRKLLDSMTILALESKKVAEAILVFNNRLNEHEQLILKLVELQRAKPKDSLDIDLLKTKEKPSKPN